jgi:hypothetical protein
MPSFHSLNTYGFGDSRNHNTKNTQNNTMSQDNKTAPHGIELHSRPSIRKQQLKTFRELYTHVSQFNQNPQERWKALPICVRNEPKTLLIALRASNAYPASYPQTLDINALVNRAETLNAFKRYKVAGEDSPSILAWMGKNKAYLWSNHRYDTHAWFMLWQRAMLHAGSDRNDGKQPWHAGAVTLHNEKADYCAQNGSQLHNALSWLIRNARVRLDAHSHLQDLLRNCMEHVPVKDRLYRIKESIYATRAIHWTQSLTPIAYRIANRLRPQGACVGIELEFVGSRGSEISTWSSDDFPAQPFHSFKHDGSISTNASDEVVCSLQEYTAFINSESNEDWSDVFKALTTITGNGAIVNNTCGNHVHIDMRHKSNASYYRTAGKMRDAMNTWAHRLVSVKRAYNRYCGIQNSHHSNRYTAVNTQCWTEHRTVEVRIGMPTLNPHKLKYWTRFLQYLARDRNQCDTFENFMNGDAPLDLKLYAVRRIKKFESTYLNAGHAALPAFSQYENAISNMQSIDHDFQGQTNNNII